MYIVQCSMYTKVRLNDGWTRVPIIHGWRERKFNKDVVYYMSCVSISPYFSFYLSFSVFFSSKKEHPINTLNHLCQNLSPNDCSTRTLVDDYKKSNNNTKPTQNYVRFTYIHTDGEQVSMMRKLLCVAANNGYIKHVILIKRFNMHRNENVSVAETNRYRANYFRHT